MDGAAEVLVIILSVFLAIFLVVGIVLSIALIKLTRTIKQVAEKAQGVVGNVEAASAALKNVAGPLAAGKFVVNIFDAVMKHKKGRG